MTHGIWREAIANWLSQLMARRNNQPQFDCADCSISATCADAPHQNCLARIEAEASRQKLSKPA